MDARKHSLSLKEQLLQAFAPGDLKRMQAIFGRVCRHTRDGALSEAACDDLAGAVIRAYDPSLNDDALVLATLFAYETSLSEIVGQDWSEALKAVALELEQC